MLHPAVAVAVALVFASRQHVATDLRVEHTLSPIDVDVAQPLFSWKLTHPERGQAQLSWKLTIYLLPRGTCYIFFDWLFCMICIAMLASTHLGPSWVAFQTRKATNNPQLIHMHNEMQMHSYID